MDRKINGEAPRLAQTAAELRVRLNLQNNQLWLFEKDHDISSKGTGKKLPTVNKEETHWELRQVRQIIVFLLYFETGFRICHRKR